MRSSSTGIGCRRASKTAASRSWTRRGLDWTEKFGQGVVDAFRNLPLRSALIDGELAVENKSGVSEFSLLQADLSEGRHDRFVYYAFDCLYLDGLRPA